MLTKENFKGEYASTILEPTPEEIEFVLNNLDLINIDKPDAFHVQGDTGCECETKEIYLYKITTPFLVDDIDEDDRVLGIIYCSKCHSWCLCD